MTDRPFASYPAARLSARRLLPLRAPPRINSRMMAFLQNLFNGLPIQALLNGVGQAIEICFTACDKIHGSGFCAARPGQRWRQRLRLVKNTMAISAGYLPVFRQGPISAVI